MQRGIVRKRLGILSCKTPYTPGAHRETESINAIWLDRSRLWRTHCNKWRRHVRGGTAWRPHRAGQPNEAADGGTDTRHSNKDPCDGTPYTGAYSDNCADRHDRTNAHSCANRYTNACTNQYPRANSDEHTTDHNPKAAGHCEAATDGKTEIPGYSTEA